MLLKRIAAKLPHKWQTGLKRIHFSRQIDKDLFESDEPEYRILDKIVSPGDWVLDIGANVGHYTKRLSELAGDKGRVIAFEPVATTFSLLSSNTLLFKYPNITLINAAVSDKMEVLGMTMPSFDTGLSNFYRAHLSSPEESNFSVLTLSIDSLCIPHKIAFVKIDVEGHESFVIAGMKKLIEKYHPILVIETTSDDFIDNINKLGYTSERLPNSPNILFKPESLN